MRNYKDQWRCVICEDERNYQPLSEAITHEQSVGHTNALRNLDRPMELSSPPLLAVDQVDDHENFEGSRSADIEGPEERANALFDRLEARDWREDSRDRYSIHGPALPNDHPHQLYDDWEGELSTLEDHYTEIGSTFYGIPALSPLDDLSEVDDEEIDDLRGAEEPWDDAESISESDQGSDFDTNPEVAQVPLRECMGPNGADVPVLSLVADAVCEDISPEILLGQENTVETNSEPITRYEEVWVYSRFTSS